MKRPRRPLHVERLETRCVPALSTMSLTIRPGQHAGCQPRLRVRPVRGRPPHVYCWPGQLVPTAHHRPDHGEPFATFTAVPASSRRSSSPAPTLYEAYLDGLLTSPASIITVGQHEGLSPPASPP